FLANFEDEEDLYYKFTRKATLLSYNKNFVPFKIYSKKRAKKVRRGSNLLIKFILSNKGINILSELPIIYLYLIGVKVRV
ncbi:hypothetical protein B0H65DRAFT_430764, partial [Neurospora tetraspora]